MKKSVRWCALAAVVVGVALLGVARQAHGQTTHKTTKTGKTTDSYTVVQITGEPQPGVAKPADGADPGTAITYKVITASKLNDEKKRIADANKKAKDEWQDEVKIDPTAKQPARIILKIVKSGFKTQKVADEYVTKLKKDKDEGKDDNASGDTKF